LSINHLRKKNPKKTDNGYYVKYGNRNWLIVNELCDQKFFIDNQLVTRVRKTGIHNSLIVNKLFFKIILPVQNYFVSLLCKVSNIGVVYIKFLI